VVIVPNIRRSTLVPLRLALRRIILPIRFSLLGFLVILLGACSLQREYEAVLVITDIAAGTAPTRLKSVTPQPKRTTVSLTAAGRAIAADLYLSPEKPLAGILLLPGAAEKGKDDPRLLAFANSLARARFAVLVPDFESYRSLKVNSEDIRRTADAFAWLANRPDLAPGRRAGIFSFSYASGPAILAALQPQAAGRVAFIMAVGGYHNVRDVLTFFTTGYHRDGERWLYREPNSYGKWVFVLSNLERLSDPGDQRLFREAAERKLKDVNAPVGDLTERLTPEGKRVLSFVENRDRSRAQQLIEELPAAIKNDINALDLARYDLTRLKTRFILVHGYDDDIIPYTQSIDLAKNLPPKQTRLYLVNGLQHVDLKPGILDKYRLWRAISALLKEREG
jgi:pimeloyl-ACP methyl ester carboxylesterase